MEDSTNDYKGPDTMLGFIRFLIFLCLAVGFASCVHGGEICYRNGVACNRVLYPIANSTHQRIAYEPIVKEIIEIREEVVDYVAPLAEPNARELLQYDDDDFDDALIKIIAKSQRDKDRRAILKQLGISLAGEKNYPVDSYNRSTRYRPSELNYGISVKESVDYIGSDPTDVISGNLGRQMDRIGDLQEGLVGSQASALEKLIQSRGVNTERLARAFERQAEASADATKIKAMADAVKRTHIDRSYNLSGSFLDILKRVAVDSTSSVSSHPVQKIIDSKCAKCHDPSLQSYNADRVDLSKYLDLPLQDKAVVLKRIRGDSMPPEGEPQLTVDQERILVDHYFADSLKGD